MRPDEAFVGDSLVTFLGGPARASFREGGDPPDLLVVIDGGEVGVEVTRLSQFTIAADGTLGNRLSDDIFGTRLLDDLDRALGPLLPNDVDLIVVLEMPAENGKRFSSLLRAWIEKIVETPAIGAKHKTRLQGAEVKVTVVGHRGREKRIVGLVGNLNSSPDIGLNARLVLEDRIRTKNDICVGLGQPIWLALLNEYWLADFESYVLAYKAVQLQHCFERILVVDGGGTVGELKREA